jgi:hypothetical protein
MKDMLWIGLLCASLCAASCQRHDGSMSDADRAALAEEWRLVNVRHMPCQPEEVAAILDGYLVDSAKPVSARLVPIRNDGGLHYAWVVSVNERVETVLTSPMPVTTSRPVDGPASIALRRARMFIAEHFDHRNSEARKDEQPIPAEHITSQYQERVYGVQITSLELEDPRRMLWKVTAVPTRKNVDGGQIWMRFSPNSGVSPEFGR